MRFFLSLFLFFASLVGLFAINSEQVFAVTTSTKSTALDQLTAGGKGAGYDNVPSDPRIITAKIIDVFLGLIGSVAVFLFVYAGYLLITSHGDESKLTKSRQIMSGAIIGILVILLAFSITNFVAKKLQQNINETTQPN